MNDLYIIAIGSLIAASCALLGCFLVLRKMALIGDAISHAVLPGIVVAYLFTGSRDSFIMILGAGTIGLLTTFLIEFLHRKARLQEDASIGVIFTTLFALGVILISYYAENIDLDQDCVLYGEIALAPLDTWVLPSGFDMGPRTFWIGLIMLILVVFFILLGYKELFLTTFDPSYAASIGISVTLWHYLLMGMVSFTTVASFEAVGAILVVAFLVAPASTAYLLTDQINKMLLISVLAGILAAAGGYFLALWLDASIAGGMSTVAGIEFMLALFLSPSQGILMKKLKLKVKNV
ncbi:MAG TPA: metal ABC transporter permease [Cytophagaceae bacterium]|nr:metal ABC transporter permease [Cytophagaceae bacterium]